MSPGANEEEHATPALSLCHGIFTDWSIFSIPFLLWKKGSSGPVTQWRQLVSCDWSWHSHGSLIIGKFVIKMNHYQKTPWQKYSGVACSYSEAPDVMYYYGTYIWHELNSALLFVSATKKGNLWRSVIVLTYVFMYTRVIWQRISVNLVLFGIHILLWEKFARCKVVLILQRFARSYTHFLTL